MGRSRILKSLFDELKYNFEHRYCKYVWQRRLLIGVVLKHSAI
jgi:hypothetical protein